MNTPSALIGRGALAIRVIGLLLLASFVMAGCGDDPTDPGTDFSARGIALRSGSIDTVVVDSTSLRGSLRLDVGTTTGPIDVQFIKKDGTRGVPGTEFTLAWTIADPTIFSIESTSAWQFKAQGKKDGGTTVTFRLMKSGTTVYTSIAIPVSVGAMGFGQGDTVVYNFYDRDMENNRVTSSHKLKFWRILNTGITFEGKTGVTQVLETTTDGTGGIFFGNDTLYIQMAADGRVYEYDVLGSLLARVEGAADVLGNALTPQWTYIGNTSLQGTASWNALQDDSLQAKNLSLPGVPVAVNMIVRMAASHKGEESLTVPAGVYSVYRTDHTVKLNVQLAAFPVSVLTDSLGVRFAISPKDGVIAQSFESKVLKAELSGQQRELPVMGYEMELVNYLRKK